MLLYLFLTDFHSTLVIGLHDSGLPSLPVFAEMPKQIFIFCIYTILWSKHNDLIYY